MIGIASLYGFATEGRAQQLTQQLRNSTHDWTAPVGFGGETTDFREFWADVKTPGDGFAYVVGTIEVQNTQATAQFSQQNALPSLPGSGFLLSANLVRQVAMLQRVNTTTQLNSPQRYFFGSSPVAQNLRSTNARGISVWPASNQLDTRVVICGETYDQTLPLSQDTVVGYPNAAGNNATGFIAVYDGALTLLWTHHFFGTNSLGECAVTDLSVRVVPVDGGGFRDVITYCGISTFGSPATGNASLTPVLPFPAPTFPSPCGAGSRAWAIGNTDNGAGQWDGFVGRLSRDHTAAGATTVEFHSVVGGSQQDGLFGLSELEDGKFAVVGSSASAGTVSAALACPGVCVLAADTYCVGTVMVFDASPVALGAPLELDAVDAIGQPGEMSTVARDVIAQPGSNVPFGGPVFPNTLMVVGSTNDGSIAGDHFLQQTAFSGPTDGFIATYSNPGVVSAGLGLERFGVEFQGLPGPSGYTGVNAWNEYANHAVATGFVEEDESPGTNDIDVASYYMYTVGYPSPPVLGLRLLTRGQISGTGEDRPTAVGVQEVTQGGVSLAFQTFGLGNHAGGGVSQGSSGRVQVVGTTRSLDFPDAGTLGAGRPRSTALPTPGLATNEDAVRSVLDLMPFGVRRTDGTGNSINLAGLVFPPPSTDGGTTPPCSLNPFGLQFGENPPDQRRRLLDFEGPPPAAGTSAGIVVVRTPPTAGWTLAAIQIGFPGSPGLNLPLLVNSAEIWTPFPASLLSFPAAPNATFYALIPGFPPPPAQFTIQALFLLSSTVVGGNPAQGGLCGGTETVVASPALYIDY
ncbi:MAG: hypothetical protein ABL997_07615 [Planctomycetota bacterium]